METELDKAHKNILKIKEIDIEIKKHREFQLSCKKANDSVGDKAWANKIKELNAERFLLCESSRYARFTVFTQVVKAYLTKKQYEDCWDRVDQVMEHPELMQ